VAEATGRGRRSAARHVESEQAIVLASGNLGLIYLMEVKRRLSMEEIDDRHPDLLPALRTHPHIGLVMVHSQERGPVVLGPRGTRYLRSGRITGEDPLAGLPPHAADHLGRSAAFKHAPDILINSFYDPVLDQGCAFEELISFHGGLGGTQTRPFILHPTGLPAPDAPIVGAVGVHEVLVGWRRALQGEFAPAPDGEPAPAPPIASGAL
jgi:hypothetical protein